MAASPACCLRVTECTQSVTEIHLVPNFPASSCHRHGDQPCLLFEGNDPDREKALTYAEVLEEVCKVANWLKSKGIKKGDTVSRAGWIPPTHTSKQGNGVEEAGRTGMGDVRWPIGSSPRASGRATRSGEGATGHRHRGRLHETCQVAKWLESKDIREGNATHFSGEGQR